LIQIFRFIFNASDGAMIMSGGNPDFQAPQDLDELGEIFDQRGSEVDSSCLSQWFQREFEIDGVRYPTAEHWIMAEKSQDIQG
jgi:hypothetical protein